MITALIKILVFTILFLLCKTDILLGQSAVFSGLSSRLGHDIRIGIEAALAEANNRDGVWGEHLSLISLDDGYEPENATINVLELINTYNVFLLIGEVGTPTSSAIYDAGLLSTYQIPFVGAYTGAMFLRDPFDPLIINIRASYVDEAKAMVSYLNTIHGIHKISIFYQNDSFGYSGLQGLQLALDSFGLEIESQGSYPRNTVIIEPGLQDILKGNPQAIVMFGTYVTLATFIQAARNYTKLADIPYLTVSFVGPEAYSDSLRSLNVSTDKLYVTQVVPLPTDTSITLIREYQDALAALNSTMAPGYLSLEGYVVGRFTVEALRRIWGPITRQAFVDTVFGAQYVLINNLILGPYSYNIQCNQGMREVFLTQLTSNYSYTATPGFSHTFTQCGPSSLVVIPPILFAQTTPLSGIYAEIGNGLAEGIRAAFKQTNDLGGIQGRKLSLLSLDDSAIPSIALENTIECVNNSHVLAFIGSFGSDSSQVFVPVSNAAHIPQIGLSTGAQFLRDPFNRYIVNVRASYVDEIAAITNQLVPKGINSIAFFWQNDTVGKTILDSVIQDLSYYGVTLASTGNFEENTTNIEGGLKSIQSESPQAVIMYGTSEPLVKFIKLGKGTPNTTAQLPSVSYYFSLSYVDIYKFVDDLQSQQIDTSGIYVSEIVPLPVNSTNSGQFVQHYFTALNNYNPNIVPSFSSLEGYISAQLAITVLKLISGTITAESFLDTLYRQNTVIIDELSLGPYAVECNQGLHQVWTIGITSSYTLQSVPGTDFNFPTCGIVATDYFNCKTHSLTIDRFGRYNETENLINSLKLCDGFVDCSDFSDEIATNCRTQTSTPIFTSWIVWTFISFICIAMNIIMIYVVLKYRFRTIMHTATPPFLITMIIGMIMLCLSVPLFAFPPTTFMCNFQIWVPCIGFIFILGSLLVKSWRIDKIFNEKNLAKVVELRVRNTNLAQKFLILVVLQLVILITWATADTVLPIVVPHPVFSGLYHLKCTSQNYYLFASIIIIYHVILLIYGGYLSYRTKKADKKFRESKTIAISIYQFFLFYTVLIPATLVLENQPIFRFNISAVMFILSNSIIMGAVFMGKLWSVYLEPEEFDMGTVNNFPSRDIDLNLTQSSDVDLFSIWNNGNYGSDEEFLYKIKVYMASKGLHTVD